MTTVVLDNEAVSVLLTPGSRKRPEVLAVLEAVLVRRRRGLGTDLVVPNTVRVEAGWNRSEARAASVNRLPIHDATLDGGTANIAATIAHSAKVSVADAHVAAVVRQCEGDAVVLTSDPTDIERAAAPARVRIIRV